MDMPNSGGRWTRDPLTGALAREPITTDEAPTAGAVTETATAPVAVDAVSDVSDTTSGDVAAPRKRIGK